MRYRGMGLAFCCLLLFGCARLEEPRWSMLGDTEEKAYFMDRQSVQRLANGHYQFPVKVCLYQPGQPHEQDSGRDTNQILYIEMDCDHRRWIEVGRGVMDQGGKTLFRHLAPAPRSMAIQPETMQAVAYSYLCTNASLSAVHNH